MTGLSNPTGLCQAGYFCQAGSHVFNGDTCPPNYYCPAGCAMPIRCPSGTYSDAVGKLWSVVCENWLHLEEFSELSLNKIPYFPPNFMLWKLCLSTKLSHQKNSWNYGILRSVIQTSKIEPSTFRSSTVFEESSIFDVWPGSE